MGEVGMSLHSLPDNLSRLPADQVRHLEARSWVPTRTTPECLTEMGDYVFLQTDEQKRLHMNDQSQMFVGSLIRHGLTTAAGYLGATAYINGSWMDAAVAFGVATVGLVWSFLQKRYFAKILAS